MKGLIYIITIPLIFASLSFAEINRETSAENQCPAEQISIDLFAGQGCCSHHGGQCGCSGGRVKCCDGTLSPSCGCMKDDTIPVFNMVF